MNKRVLSLLVCILCAFTAIPALGGGQAAGHFTMAGFDGDGSAHQWETNGFFVRMEKGTGLSFDFDEYVNYDDWQEAKAKMFDTGDLPDVLFKAALTTEEQYRYSESGQLMDLKPLLAEHAPNLWALLLENADWMQAITLPGGEIVALPGLNELSPQNLLWINQQWLTQLGLEMPTDAQSLREVLLAFRDKDPNQNGRKDEVPLTFLGVWDLKFLSHAFGVAVNDYNIYVDDGGTVRYWPLEDSFTQLVAYLAVLYQEKLLDANGFYTVESLRASTDENAAITYGAFWGTTPLSLYGIEQSKQYVALPPLRFEGKQVYRDMGTQLTRGTFALTSACKDPAALLRWVDVLYTPEGAIQAMVGTEGADYTLDSEGRWQWEGGLEGMTSTRMNDISIYDTGAMPWLFPLAFYNRYEMEDVARISREQESLAPYLRQPFPASYMLTEAQRAQVLPLQEELGRYVDEGISRFMLGQWEATPEQMEDFRQGLVERGAEIMRTFWQEVYDQL